MNEDIKFFLTNVKKLMHELGMNQSQLARAAKLQTSAVSRWFSGANEPPYSGMAAIAKALGVSVASLLEKEPSSPITVSRDSQFENLRKLLAKDFECILVKAATGAVQIQIPQAHSELFALLLKISPQNLGSVKATAEQALLIQDKSNQSVVDPFVGRKRNGGSA